MRADDDESCALGDSGDSEQVSCNFASSLSRRFDDESPELYGDSWDTGDLFNASLHQLDKRLTSKIVFAYTGIWKSDVDVGSMLSVVRPRARVTSVSSS